VVPVPVWFLNIDLQRNPQYYSTSAVVNIFYQNATGTETSLESTVWYGTGTVLIWYKNLSKTSKTLPVRYFVKKPKKTKVFQTSSFAEFQLRTGKMMQLLSVGFYCAKFTIYRY
jgi:hypothetical protein